MGAIESRHIACVPQPSYPIPNVHPAESSTSVCPCLMPPMRLRRRLSEHSTIQATFLNTPGCTTPPRTCVSDIQTHLTRADGRPGGNDSGNRGLTPISWVSRRPRFFRSIVRGGVLGVSPSDCGGPVIRSDRPSLAWARGSAAVVGGFAPGGCVSPALGDSPGAGTPARPEREAPRGVATPA